MEANMIADVLLVSPRLALEIGLTEAMILQQLHFWLNNPHIGKEVDGVRWVYNSVKDWREQNFPFWSERTIHRALRSLEELDIIWARDDLNAAPYDQTKWYAINPNWYSRDGQIVHIKTDKKYKPIPENTREEEKSGDEKVEPLFPAVSPPVQVSVSVAPKGSAYEGVVVVSTPTPDTPAIFSSETFVAKWQEWVAYRKELKRPLKPTAVKKQLEMLAKHPVPVAIAMLEQSMLNQWQGIFELKKELPKPPQVWTPLGYNDKEPPKMNGAPRPWTPVYNG